MSLILTRRQDCGTRVFFLSLRITPGVTSWPSRKNVDQSTTKASFEQRLCNNDEKLDRVDVDSAAGKGRFVIYSFVETLRKTATKSRRRYLLSRSPGGPDAVVSLLCTKHPPNPPLWPVKSRGFTASCDPPPPHVRWQRAQRWSNKKSHFLKMSQQPS